MFNPDDDENCASWVCALGCLCAAAFTVIGLIVVVINVVIP